MIDETTADCEPEIAEIDELEPESKSPDTDVLLSETEVLDVDVQLPETPGEGVDLVLSKSVVEEITIISELKDSSADRLEDPSGVPDMMDVEKLASKTLDEGTEPVTEEECVRSVLLVNNVLDGERGLRDKGDSRDAVCDV